VPWNEGLKMLSGAHFVIFSKDAEADREFFRTVLGFPHVDAGDGWLIFALPPAEMAVHSAEQNGAHELYLMCDDLDATLRELHQRNVEFSRPLERDWGKITNVKLPGGGEVGLYQPKHPLAPR
jgi:catechol 2,3-dioxygenase-like lactoylglutathione lyase family enzyme